jgi:hypothetical protein
MTFVEKGLTITLILLTINAALFVLGIPGDEGTSVTSDSQLAWVRGTELESTDFSENKGDTTIEAQEVADKGVLATLSDLVIRWIPYAKESLALISVAYRIINSLLFGFAHTMMAILPSSMHGIVWIVSIPLFAIELITILFLILHALSAIAGVIK